MLSLIIKIFFCVMSIFHRKPMLTDSPSLFDNLMERDLLDPLALGSSYLSTPAVNVRETKNEYAIDLAAPGMAKSDFRIGLEGNVLTISSERSMENKEGSRDKGFTRQEFNYTSFSRSFTLPEGADCDHIHANYQNGMLCVNIPKKEEIKKQTPKQIAIK